jgi:hypothetical protein
MAPPLVARPAGYVTFEICVDSGKRIFGQNRKRPGMHLVDMREVKPDPPDSRGTHPSLMLATTRNLSRPRSIAYLAT